ncbi:MAG: hypothetical protein ACLTSZ_17160 [Lachnospiraceae bacterium]
MALQLGVKSILFVSHIGKFIKVSGGIMNTHSAHADCRAELMAAQAMRAGASADTVKAAAYDEHDRGGRRHFKGDRRSGGNRIRSDPQDSVLSAKVRRRGAAHGGRAFLKSVWLPRRVKGGGSTDGADSGGEAEAISRLTESGIPCFHCVKQ